ncbi:MAG TPA: hypothetical protein VHG72_21710 [Polyangia bacterium]|nr:hypothetical protein [Polyangia bacterium]
MAGYVKMFQSILDSTIWKQPASITKVWMTMMAMADRDGVVTAAVPGLADRANVSVAIAEKALDMFLSPDPYSKTPDNEGRRIEAVRGGWRLLNFEMYREMMSADDQRTKNAERQQRWRDRHRNADVTLRNGQCDITEAESEPGSLPPDLSRPSPGSGSGRAGAGSNAKAKAPGPAPIPPTIPRDQPIRSNDLTRIYGEVRCQLWGGLPWQNCRDANGKSSDMAVMLNETPGSVDLVIPTMTLLFEKAKSGALGRRSADILRSPAFGFAAWVSMWTELCEEVLGAAPTIPKAAQPTAAGEEPWKAREREAEERKGRERAETRQAVADMQRAMGEWKAS